MLALELPYPRGIAIQNNPTSGTGLNVILNSLGLDVPSPSRRDLRMSQLMPSIIACACYVVGLGATHADLPPRASVRSSTTVAVADPIPPPQSRRSAGEADLKYWLENMVWH